MNTLDENNMKIAIIISTNGGVLSQLLKINYFREKVYEVISDRECGAINIAKKVGIRTSILKSNSGNEFSEKLLKYLDVSSVDLFISFYTRIFNKKFVGAVKNKIINLHPSILPACPGIDGFGDTIKSGSKFIGSTIHFVDDGIDTGTPIIQSAIPFNNNKPIEEMRHLIFNDQCKTLLQAIKWFEEKRIQLNDKKLTIDKVEYDSGIYSPKLDFDEAIKFNIPYQSNEPCQTKTTANESTPIIDLRNSTNHPVSLQYSEIYSNALLTGKIIDGRSQPGFALTNDTPFVLAAKNAIAYGIEKEGVIEVIKEVLSNYYDLVQPKSATEWLGLKLDRDHILSQSPPWASVFPWRARSVESYRLAYEKAAILENKISGGMLDISKGWLFCGPVSMEKCRVEAQRIDYVLKEISRNGYQRWDTSEGDVKATALVKENGDWKWLITAGNHRASAAAVLGFEEIPIRVNLVIHRQHVKLWSHVVDGLYTENSALQVFDNYFDAKTPYIIQSWLTAINCTVK